jgi:hypothetical protein
MSLVEQELLTITRVIRPLPLVEQELVTITKVTRSTSGIDRIILVMATVPTLLVVEVVLLL